MAGKIKFGLQWRAAVSGKEFSEVCKEVEDLGYHSIAIPDHFFVGMSTAPPMEPFTGMGFIAGATSTLRMLPFVSCNDFRHPALYARSIATLDLLSEGRVEAGIGAGWYQPEYEATGIGFDDPKVRVARLAEAVTIIKSYWSDESVSFTGDHYKIKDLPAQPKPLQKPHPPLLIGAGAPKMLQLAGREADIVAITASLRDFTDRDLMLKQMSPASISGKIESVKASARSAGRDPESVQMGVQFFEIGFDGDDPGHLWALKGEPAAMVDQINRYSEMGLNYFFPVTGDRQTIRRLGKEVIAKL